MTGLAPLLGALALVVLAGVFAAIDAAVSTASIARWRSWSATNARVRCRLAQMVEERPRYINLVVLLRIACETTATVLLAAYLTRMGLDRGLIAAAAIMVVTSFVVIGVGPRTLGRQNAYSISLAAALPLHAISVLLTPISRLLILLGNALTPGRGFRNQGRSPPRSRLREVVDLAQQRGVVADDERRMIQSVFELGDTPAREVMVPRTEMVWIEADKNAGQATSLAVRSGHSRIPVIGENVDDIVGVVYLKDLVGRTYYSTNGGRDTLVGELMRPAVFVPDSNHSTICCARCNAPAITWHCWSTSTRHRRTGDVSRMCFRGDRGEIADEYDADESPRPEACRFSGEGFFGCRLGFPSRISARTL